MIKADEPNDLHDNDIQNSYLKSCTDYVLISLAIYARM